MTVTAAAGFTAAGVAAGIKLSGGLDVALVLNHGPLQAAAAVFTANRVKAAPVLWSQQAIADGRISAVVLNAGGANACTGPAGFADTHRTAEKVSELLSLSASDVIVCSTGLIGERLPMQALLAGVEQAAAQLGVGGGAAAADAIRTTDTVPKTASTSHPGGWTIGGMAKGAGMLAPGLATMLCVITTDAVAHSAELEGALRSAVATTFNRIDADGCMSTNDTVVLMASGASGVVPTAQALSAGVKQICAALASQLLADAEGATKEVTIVVHTAATESDAEEVGRAIARNNLLKCALFGNDPNWGRVLAAIGTTNASFEPDRLDVRINEVQLCRSGGPGEPREGVDLTGRQILIEVQLHAGSESATVWTNDLSHGYVEENSAYSS